MFEAALTQRGSWVGPGQSVSALVLTALLLSLWPLCFPTSLLVLCQDPSPLRSAFLNILSLLTWRQLACPTPLL